MRANACNLSQDSVTRFPAQCMQPVTRFPIACMQPVTRFPIECVQLVIRFEGRSMPQDTNMRPRTRNLEWVWGHVRDSYHKIYEHKHAACHKQCEQRHATCHKILAQAYTLSQGLRCLQATCHKMYCGLCWATFECTEAKAYHLSQDFKTQACHLSQDFLPKACNLSLDLR